MSGQNSSLKESIIEDLIVLRFKTAEKKIQLLKTDEKKIFKAIHQIMYHRGQESKLDTIIYNSFVKVDPKNYSLEENLIIGFYNLYYIPKNASAVKNFYDAYVESQKSNKIVYLKLSIIGILELYKLQNTQSSDYFQSYLEQFGTLLNTDEERALFELYNCAFQGGNIYGSNEFYFTAKKLIKINQSHALNPALRARILEHICIYYRACGMIDSTHIYSDSLLLMPTTSYNKVNKFHALLNKASVEAMDNNFITSKAFLEKAMKYIDTISDTKSRYSINKFQSQYIYEPLKLWDKAYFSLKSAFYDKADLEFMSNKLKISEVNIQEETAEKDKTILQQDKDLLIQEKQKTKNENIAIALGGGLLAVSLIGFLLFKNTKRKQHIAEQEREIEIQKTEKLLKEQELTTIDAMIEGQEKERQRLASDLHDSVGATLSAAKLQFDHLSKNKDKLDSLDDLFSKTKTLLDDAYNEVRSMAHLKNSGVIAKNGLLPAVEKLAKNASSTNKLKVEVQDFGLENRLESTLEITIFRIIQELVTNIIKHANASEASISITQHKESLSIIVEDNGNGFNAQKVQKKEGMGLSGIERRIEHLEGALEVDSTLGKGTSILIDIPL
ncbi:MAG: sensor histidine kinase [Flavobacteriaceae bacterium]|nr:sensor histidine kinase [Flavobacteriaceae bacterium]